jgi:hypothetical protein
MVDETATRKKLTKEQRAELEAAVKSGTTVVKLAEKYGITEAAVRYYKYKPDGEPKQRLAKNGAANNGRHLVEIVPLSALGIMEDVIADAMIERCSAATATHAVVHRCGSKKAAAALSEVLVKRLEGEGKDDKYDVWTCGDNDEIIAIVTKEGVPK